MTYTFTRNFSRPGETIPSSVTATGDSEITADPEIPTGDPTPITDYVVALAVDVSTVQAVYMLSDQTVHANVNTGGGQAIELVAGRAIEWVVTDTADNPLGAVDATQLVFDNANLVAANVNIRILVDCTPV